MQQNVVLLVEDNQDEAVLVQRAFGKIGPGYMLVHVSDAKEAMAYLLGKGQYADRVRFPSPRLMLLDLVMPGVGGWELLEWIRQQPEMGSVSVVVLSTAAHSEDVKRAYKLGADSFVAKTVK